MSDPTPSTAAAPATPPRASETSPERGARLGTFGGVFVPNVLTILGVIMFLRLGQIVGQAGVWDTILIILCAKLITSLTAVSLAGIATNTRVRGGGAYFLISRSLGPEFGGAIGVVFYLAQAISVALYVIGFTDALCHAFPALEPLRTPIASAVNVVTFLCVFVGAGWTIRIQYGILVALGLSLLSFFIGGAFHFSPAQLHVNMAPAYDRGVNVFTMFALFFPAATGIMAGANLSGDLKTPDKSLPMGTFGAIGATALIYLLIALFLGGSSSSSALKTDVFIMNDIALAAWLVVLGIFAATLSSALGSMMGAPRILQALSLDAIFPSLRFLGRGSGATNEPRYATAVTFVVAQAAIMVGDLDLIAPIISMFFLVTYGLLNLACFYEGFSRNPSFRPRFRFSHWSLSLVGAAGCAVAMLLIAPLWAGLAVVAIWGLYWYIRRSGVRVRWGDVQSGVAFEQARTALVRLEEQSYHPKNWRPTILALSGTAWSRYDLAQYGHWLAAGRGLLTLAQVVSGDIEGRMEVRTRHERRLRQFIREHELEAFAAVVVDENLLAGVKMLLQCYGIGNVRPNTVLLGWSEDLEKDDGARRLLALVHQFHLNLLIVKADPDVQLWEKQEGTIDVWWRSPSNGSLMFLLAYLLSQNAEFARCPIRVLQVVANESARAGVTEHLASLIERSRISATVEVLVATDVTAAVRDTSRAAAVTFLGFNPLVDSESRYFDDFHRNVLGHLDTAILVASAGDVDLEA